MKKTLENVVQSTDSESKYQPKISYRRSLIPFYGWAKDAYDQSYLSQKNKGVKYDRKSHAIGVYSSWGAFLAADAALYGVIPGSYLTKVIGFTLGWVAILGALDIGAEKLGKRKSKSEVNQ